MIDLRGPGRWQDLLLVDERFDVLITDPPYGRRSMMGFRSGNDYRAGAAEGPKEVAYSYDAWSDEDPVEFVEWAVNHIEHWIIIFNDDDTSTYLRSLLRQRGWYVFGDVPWCKSNGPPRFQGDGPASSSEHITVARPTRAVPYERTGSRPGFYLTPQQNGGAANAIVTGQKPMPLMRQLMRDYTLPGDKVVDPFCGSASTSIAAAENGRSAVTCEMNPETFEKAKARIARGWVVDPFQTAPRKRAPKPKDMFE